MRKESGNIGAIVSILFFISIPFIACVMICLKEGIWINEVYIANSFWNDEAFYYKMIGAVARYNQPLGYFGYNGSYANIGRFGPWSPVLFIFYILYAKIFGWSMLSPIYCNILLMTMAMAVFAFLVRPTRKQVCFFGLLYCFSTIITRYVFSDMSEITIYALLIVYIGISVRMLRQKEKHNAWYEIALNGLTFLLTLMRPYWLLLTVIPGYYWYHRSHKKIIVVWEGVWSLVCVVVYFFISKNFCAAYYKSIIDFDWLTMLFDHPIQGVHNMLHILVSSIWEILQSAGEGIVNGSPAGSIYTLYILAMIYFISVYRQCTDSDIKKFCLGYWLFYFVVMLMAIIYLYDINVGSRHATGFILIFIFIIAFAETSKKKYLLLLGSFVWLLCIRATEPYTYQIPVYTDEKAEELEKGRDELTRKGDLIDLSSNDPWDNTIIWLYSDESVMDFTYLYALPDGLGIELYFKEDVLRNFDELKPKYIMTNIGEEIDCLCEEREKEKMAEYGNIHIWKLR